MQTQALFVRSLGALGCTWALEGVHCLAVGLVIKIGWEGQSRRDSGGDDVC
jgi:hypothetical protein